MSRDVSVAAPLKADAFGGSPVFRVWRGTLASTNLRPSYGAVKRRRALSSVLAAVNNEVVPEQERGRRRGEKHHGLRNLLWPAQAPCRDLVDP